MARTRETLQTVTFYVALEATQTISKYDFTAADFLDNLQVRQEDDNMFYTSISKDYRKIYLRNNFRVNDLVFGSPIAVCFTYANGEKEWVKRVDAQSSNAKNINTLVGYWMEGKTFAQWKSHVNYKGHPYIGRAEDAIIVTMGYYEPEGVEPPPVIEDDEPEVPEDPKPEPVEQEPVPPPKPNRPFIFVPAQEEVKEPMLANIMLRNARYRGPRESYKELMQQDEFLYDAEILYATLDYFEQMTEGFLQELYGIDAEFERANSKRYPELFEESYGKVLNVLSNYMNTSEVHKRLIMLREQLDTIQEVRINYE